MPVVNDIHSQLSRTEVARIVCADSVTTVQDTLVEAAQNGTAICVCGGRHSTGGQQFASGAVLIDTTAMNHVLNFDADKGLIEVEAGIRWPDLIEHLVSAQAGKALQWGILQKQTGADRFTIGGTVAANSHGRGLCLKPFMNSV